MEIIRNDCEILTYDDLKIGDVFTLLAGERVCIKTKYGAFLLENGEEMVFFKNDMVKRLKAKLIIE